MQARRYVFPVAEAFLGSLVCMPIRLTHCPVDGSQERPKKHLQSHVAAQAAPSLR